MSDLQNQMEQQMSKAAEIADRHGDLHPWHVAATAYRNGDGADFNVFLTGLLHDSIEDGYATDEELSVFPTEVRTAVHVLTRRDGERYWDYIERVKGAPELAQKVKIADASVNLDRCKDNPHYKGLAKRYHRVLEELA